MTRPSGGTMKQQAEKYQHRIMASRQNLPTAARTTRDPLSQLFPSLHAQSRRKSRTVVDALRDHQWVRDLRPDMPPPALAQFLQAWALLLDANTQLHPGTTDSITWTLTADGNYSAKSAYLVQFAGRQHAPMTVAIWDTWMPPKIRIFSWLLH